MYEATVPLRTPAAVIDYTTRKSARASIPRVLMYWSVTYIHVSKIYNLSLVLSWHALGTLSAFQRCNPESVHLLTCITRAVFEDTFRLFSRLISHSVCAIAFILQDLSEITFSELTQLVAGYLLDSNPPHEDLRINANQQTQVTPCAPCQCTVQYNTAALYSSCKFRPCSR